MKILSHIRKSAPFGLRSWGILLVLALCSFVCARAQVIIGGNVYGGGDMGDVNGSTTVHVLSGDMEGSVFGGARMANVGGSAFVNIDGAMTDNENKEIAQTDYIVINRVYGGNDISGTIGDINTPTTPPTELTNKPEEVDNSFKTFVHISNQKDEEGDTKQIYIGQLFGGGNGDYGSGYDTYTDGIYQGKNKPVLTNTYVDIQGGSIVYAYGGGNNATVTGKAVIHVDNPSEVVNQILSDKTDPTSKLLTSDRFKRMGINTGYSHPSSDEFQIGRLFGGNNQAEMAIRPTWHLQSGKIRNLYSGGNKGPMTNMQGLLLDIDPRTADGENPLVIDNVYGGSRMADVRPLRSGRIDDNPVNAQDYEIQLGSDVKDKNGQSYAFPDGLAARVLVRGGIIRNVYGGNDVTGRVYGGNAVGIYTTIYGDVYGGGNGSYPYTDNPALENDDVYGDFYYGNYYGNPISIQKLNDFRPDAEQISIRLKGNSSNEKTIIHGSVYLGGNSATIDSPMEDPLVQLRIGSHVIADKVFMGNNGENMVTINEQKVDDNEDVTQMEGILHAMAKPITNETNFNSIDLKIEENFKAYMEGAAMSLNPNSKNRIVIDDDYEDYSTQIGSFYCGGNVGSMIYSGKQTMDFDEKIIIYDKLVGGCNNADVPKTAYNAAYEGGVMGSASEIQQNSTIDRLELNFNGLRVVPKRWNEDGDDLVFNTAIWGDIYTQVSTGTTLTNGGTYYTSATGGGKFTVNVDNRTVGENESIFEKSDEDFINTGTGSPDDTHDDQGRRLMGGNIYGGCYNSGHVNGNIVININDNIIDRYGPNGIFADAIPDPDDPDGLIIDGERRSGVILDNQAVDVMAVAMTVFGAGKGKHTEVWGSTTVNLNKGYTLQIFGGGEEGVVGKGATNDTYDSEGYYVKTYTPYTDTQEDQAKAIAYSSTVNLDGESAVYNDTDNPADLAEAEYMYGGGNEGDVYGNSYVYLGNGRIYDAFGGASDAKIYGHTEVYIGHNSSHEDKFPYIRDIVYGGNDFGGSILGEADLSGRVRVEAKTMATNISMSKASTYVEYLQGKVDTIFGGSYGFYNYYDTDVYGYEDEDLKTIRQMPTQHNSFVNVRPNNNIDNRLAAVFGAGTGFPHDRRGDAAQQHSYVLIDIPQDQEQFRYTQIFGAGAFNGVGMGIPYSETIKSDQTLLDEDEANEFSAVIDLISGKVGAAYGGSYMEGVTRRTVVNVPEGSTIDIGSIFGGAYGTETIYPCDVYEANVNYRSRKAIMEYNPDVNEMLRGTIYGGNNSERQTVYSKINISDSVRMRHPRYGITTGYVYGAGYGPNTWSQYTEVNLESGAVVYEAYGGGENGKVLNIQTVEQYMHSDTYKALKKPDQKPENLTDQEWEDKWDEIWANANRLGGTGYDPSNGDYVNYSATNLNNPLVIPAEIDDRAVKTHRYNTNVRINNGAYVANYAYGGGKGEGATVSGSTYIALLGGSVNKDIYAAGTSGAVMDLHEAANDPNQKYQFTASSTAYIEGGTVRNVYGGGWRGSVGYAKYKDGPVVYHNEDTIRYEQIPDFYVDVDNNNEDDIHDWQCSDILGESHIVIGKIDGTSHTDGIPSITRNVYGGGEGGAIYGTAYLTINNGYIGYRYKNGEYVEENDDTAGDNALAKHGGNVFGGGYVANSYVDITDIRMFGGTIRGSLFGGGEIAPVGRGTVKQDVTEPSFDYITNTNAKIYKPGKTQVRLYSGQIGKNVFGGGRGYDNWEGDGWMDNVEKKTMDLSSKGFVFGNTEVYIYGGKIGTKDNVLKGYGNVFGGGDEGFVYSATGTKSSTDGYYYGSNNKLTEDCMVLVSPYAQVKSIKLLNSITVPNGNNTGKTYQSGEYLSYQQFQELPASIKSTLTEGTDWQIDNDPISVNGNSYAPITVAANILDPTKAFILTSDMNHLTEANTEEWNRIDRTGIEIGNAVFAGGNVSAGSDNIYVNSTAVYGNATASVTDVFAKDLITIGEDGIGGLYGDGNMTFVDGYRELNITNYGTDYYNLQQSIDIDEYNKLSDRERAYFELLYTRKEEGQLDYYESKGTHVVIYNNQEYSYKRGQKIPAYKTDEQGQAIQESGQNVDSDELTLIKTIGDISNWEKKPTKTYTTSVRITEDDYNLFWENERNNWELYGFCTLYAGRMINTIQRADFCGVFGSRVVMRGAQDRVPKTVDYTEYTINRVKEVSLNIIPSPSNPTVENLKHGNYFGIYNVVNYLGALTSDVKFDEERKTKSTEEGYETDGGESYYEWKRANLSNRKRNNGTSLNEVALASGVWLELLDESSETKKVKEYGPITGIVQLTLINVAPGEGGGYVYAKNQHGVQHFEGNEIVTLSVTNNNAVSYKQYHYDDPLTPEQAATENAAHKTAKIKTTDINGKEPGEQGYIDTYKLTADSEGRTPGTEGYVTTYELTYEEGYPIEPKMQSSGNFVNSIKRIIDDCYPQSGSYYDRGETKAAPAHYWYIRGDYYVYDQYLSAYTGSAQAYAQNVTIPLTITAESQGKLQLADIKENLYAYWNNIESVPEKYRSQVDRTAILVGGLTYKKNDPITFWAYDHLSDEEKQYFTKETWICSNDATYNNITYTKGDVYLPENISSVKDIYVSKEAFKVTNTDQEETQYEKGHVFTSTEYAALTGENQNKCAAVFNISNDISHDNGFLLTFDWDNPDVWNDYYHSITGDNTVKASAGSMPANYITSPSFKFNGSEDSKKVLGQLKYEDGDIIDYQTYSKQAGVIDYVSQDKVQAQFDEVYIVTSNHSFITNAGVQYVPNACISKYTYENELTTAEQANFDVGKLCNTTYEYQLSTDLESSYIVSGTVIPLGSETNPAVGTYQYLLQESQKENSTIPDPTSSFSDGYICTAGGYWGGTLFEGSRNYPAVNYSNLSKDERRDASGDYFTYNYDALDLLVDPQYSGTSGLNGTTLNMSMYDKPNTQLYSKQQSIDYEATYTGNESLTLPQSSTVKYYDSETGKYKEKTASVVQNGEIITNTTYESLINEAANYTPIIITSKHKTDTTYYVVKTGLQIGDKWYSEGNQMTYAVWDGLNATDKNKVVPVTFQSLTGSTTALPENEVRKYYFCTKDYTAITPITDINGNSYSANQTISAGTIIPETGNNSDGYTDLRNDQRYFSINGQTPTETSTLYVARDVDINNLSKDKIITVLYYYDYMESDESGSSYEKIREYHVVNVHVHFESGMPSISELKAPDIVLPGDGVKLNQPTVSKGAYEILGGGWEIYQDQASADRHRNGIPFNSSTPLYWYQDGYVIAYYALSYLGKTYSNTVPLSVANYHRMNDILTSDIVEATQEVVYSTDNEYMYLNKAIKPGKRNPKVYIGNDSELKKFAVFYNKTLTDSKLDLVQNCENLDFILDSDIKHTGTWTSIASGSNECFSGILHGDGYTISGLDNSLFGNLCKDVYNLGVTGTFTGAGIAESGTGYIENSWISTTADTKTTRPILGNPQREANDARGTIQIVNSYYLENDADAYTTQDNVITTTPKDGSYTKIIADAKNDVGYIDNGTPIRKDAQAFYNGEVAYNLNGFYLNKRFYDNNNQAITGTSLEYKFIQTIENQDGTLSTELRTGYYPAVPDTMFDVMYINDRFIDGDYQYAGGSITVDASRRYYVDDIPYYAPIWPDDYIFFGQNLTYDYDEGNVHQDVPSHYNGSSNITSNRVYRAPAYYGDSNMGVAHFNANAVLAATANGDASKKGYPEMTAIDFTGGNNDVTGTSTNDYKLGRKNSKFYAPLLDYEGLTGFRNDGQTKNMLVYAPQSDAASVTVLNNYLFEPEYLKYACQVDNNGDLILDGNNPVKNDYLSIRKVENNDVNNIHGHLVLKRADGEYYAARDQFLVDKNDHNEPFDFNAPISYVMDGREDGYKNVMWYQRVPDIFVKDASNGWESISLPFTVQTVSTNQKGIITHFYEGSKVGHEYWLRTPSKVEVAESKTKILFKSLAKASAGDIAAGKGTDLTYSNSFLWDHYYSKNSQLDKNGNGDKYHAYYNYGSGREPDVYKSYPFAAAAQPYLIGFPSDRYYEFDLSGQFEALTTVADANPVVNPDYLRPGHIGIQTITFVSDENYHTDRDVTIGVSDVDYDTEVNVEDGNYLFKPIYQVKEVQELGNNTYLLNETGTEFKLNDSDAKTTPFRAYFIGQTGGASMRGGTRATALYLGYLGDQDDLEEVATQSGLIIYSQDLNIHVESTLEYPADVTIMTVAGKTLKQFTIQPGTKVSVPVNSRGVYLVNRLKIAVTK